MADAVDAAATPAPPAPAAAAADTDDLGPQDTFTILVATDNHLGYLETDAVRGEDSFRAFEEILKLANDHQVDFILLGGDLFHENKPSRKTLFLTMEMLRRYCMGDRPCQFQFLSDPVVNFPSNRFGNVNYEDPNLNISIPCFSIHGNHDDPTGEGSLCALDLLSVAGLLNYFGKSPTVDEVIVRPILLQKGRTRLALYGLGNIRDERLFHTFEARKVHLVRPQHEPDSWFNLMTLHQNRISHSPTSFVPETALSDFLHFVVWGHEHECRVWPEENPVQRFYVTQPGSSVATSLSEGEAKPKHVALLRIKGKNFQLSPLPLTTVRPFIMEDIVLSRLENAPKPDDVQAIEKLLQARIEVMIQTVTAQWQAAHPNHTGPVPLPLVRLKVEFTGYQRINVVRFGSAFVNRVANPRDLLLMYRRRVTPTRADGKVGTEEDDVNGVPLRPVALDAHQVEDIIIRNLRQNSLTVLPENELLEASKHYVDKQEGGAISEFITATVERTKQTVQQRPDALEDDSVFKRVVAEEKQRREAAFQPRNRLDTPDPDAAARAAARNQEDDGTPAAAAAAGPPGRAPARRGRGTAIALPKATARRVAEADGGGDNASARGRQRGRARATTTTARGRGRGHAVAAYPIEDDEESEGEVENADDGSGNEEDDPISSDTDEQIVESPPRKRAAPAGSVGPKRNGARSSPKRGAAGRAPAAAGRASLSTLNFVPAGNAASAGSVTATAGAGGRRLPPTMKNVMLAKRK